jgi:hypothetical protein
MLFDIEGYYQALEHGCKMAAVSCRRTCSLEKLTDQKVSKSFLYFGGMGLFCTKIYEAEAERSYQGSSLRSSTFLEDSRRVEGDDVDTAHLLSYHHDEGCQGGTTNTRNGEEFEEAREEIAGRAEA